VAGADVLPVVEAVEVTQVGGKRYITPLTQQVIDMFYEGKTATEIATILNFDPNSVRQLLRKNGVWKVASQGKLHRYTESTGRPLIFFPGMEYEVSGNRFRLEKVMKCQSGPLYLFRSSEGGWMESFTVWQMKETVIKAMGG